MNCDSTLDAIMVVYFCPPTYRAGVPHTLCTMSYKFKASYTKVMYVHVCIAVIVVYFVNNIISVIIVYRVSIPHSVLQTSYKVRPHRRRSFDPTDSMGLSKVPMTLIMRGTMPCLQCSVTLCMCMSVCSLSLLPPYVQHCLAGWENAQPSVIPPQPKVDLKSATKPTVRS